MEEERARTLVRAREIQIRKAGAKEKAQVILKLRAFVKVLESKARAILKLRMFEKKRACWKAFEDPFEKKKAYWRVCWKGFERAFVDPFERVYWKV